MTFQAYLDNIKEKTGKTPDDFRVLAEQKGLLEGGVQTGRIIAWLKDDFGLGRGHAMAIVQTLHDATQPKLSAQERLAQRFSGDKAKWRQPFDDLVTTLQTFGPDVTVAPTDTYISLLRKDKKFGVVAVTAGRLDLGVKLKGVKLKGVKLKGVKLKGAEPPARFELAAGWNNMVTHRLRVSDPKQIDAEALVWLKKAFENAE